MIVVVVFDDLSVKKIDIDVEEIPDALDSGVINAFLRVDDNGEIRYADVDLETNIVVWKRPE